MSVIRHYAIGTVTVAAGGIVVTGVGTGWLGNIREGDILWISGICCRIAAVNSATSLTLARPWPGPAASAAVYEIWFTPEEISFRAMVRELLEQLSSGNLSALNDLDASPNQMSYFDGPGSAALTGLTAAARTLLASSLLSRDGNNLVTTSAARLTGGAVQASAADATAGRLMPVGAFGLGAAASPLATNINDPAMRNGWYRVDPAETLGEIPLATFGILEVQNYSGATTIQIFEGLFAGESRAFKRRYAGSAWTPWREVYSQNSVVGTVGRVNGVPSAAIIEAGGNANGHYTRFTDGTQICRGVVSGTSPIDAMTLWTFPAAFINTINLVVSITPLAANASPVRTVQVASLTATQLGFYSYSQPLAGGAWGVSTVPHLLTAAGRWAT